MHGVGVVLSRSSALPRPFYWLGLPSVHDLPAATLHTHSYASVCAYTSLPDASPPRARTPRLTVHSQLAAAKVASQTSASPFQILSLLPLHGGAQHPQASSSQSVPQDCFGKAQLFRCPHGTSHGSAPNTTRVLVPPQSPRSHTVFLVHGASDTGEQILEAYGQGAFPRGKACQDKGVCGSGPQDNFPAP